MKKLVREWRVFVALLFGIVVVGLIIRLVNLTIIPVFADEAIYIRWAQVMRAESTLRFLPLTDGKQPLFMWVVIPFLKVFSDPLLAGRFVSVLSGLGTMLGVILLTFLLFKNKKVALASGLFYAISPFALFFDRLALVDSMLATLGVWTAILAVLTAKFIRLDTALLAGFSLGAATLTKSPAIFFAMLTPVALVFARFSVKGQDKILRLLKLGSLLVVTFAVAFGIYNILRLGPNFHLIATRNMDYVHPLGDIFNTPLDPFLPHFDRVLEWLRLLGPELLLAFILFGVLQNFGKNKKEILFLLAWGVMPIVIQSAFARVLTARYIFFSLPYLYILAGTVFFIKTKGLGKKVFYLTFGAYVIHAMFINYQLLTNPEAARLPRSERAGYLEEWTAGTGIYEVSQYVKAEYAQDPETPIVVGTEGYFGTLPDGLMIYLEKHPNVAVIGVGLGIDGVPSQLTETVKAGNKAYLVGNKSRFNFSGNPEDLGLTLAATFDKATKPTGETDSLYLFRVNDTASINQ